MAVAKVPVIMQMEAVECGAASLAMVLAYYGKWLSLDESRLACGVSRDGSSAKGLMRAARQFGLEAHGYKMEPEQLRTCTFPAILHWEFNHFVVLDGFRGDKAIINDPARGTVTVSKEDFDKAFTGVVLCFEPGPEFKKEGKPTNMIDFVRDRLQGSGRLMLFVGLWWGLGALITMLIPFFSKIFMDNILPGTNPDWLGVLLSAMIGVLVFQFIVESVSSIYWLKVKAKFSAQANVSFMWHALRLPVTFYEHRFLGDIASRQSSNERITTTLIGKLTPIFVNLGLLVLYLVIMFQYSVILSLIGIAAVVLNLVVMRMVSARRINKSRAVERDFGKLNGMTVAGLDTIESIKSAGAEVGYFKKWSAVQATACNGKVALKRSSQFYDTLPSFIQQLASIAVLMTGVYLIMDGVFTIGMLLAFQGFLSSFMRPVNQISEVGQVLMDVRPKMERVNDVMRYEPDVPEDGIVSGRCRERLKGELELRSIDFGYNKQAEPLLKNFSLHVQPGKSVAFVGGSGSGKSTIAKLIAGLYSPWSGEILFDGKPRESYDRALVVGSLGVVDQDIVLFKDTIENNISMWSPGISAVDVVEACKAAEIHSDIMQRPLGYDHVLKEGGQDFSGGQRQRMEIARALANKPSLLILDEATSALDAKTEEDIMVRLKEQGITLIVVAHRLSTIRDCDEIIVLNNGEVSERGTHTELMAQAGKYAELLEN